MFWLDDVRDFGCFFGGHGIDPIDWQKGVIESVYGTEIDGIVLDTTQFKGLVSLTEKTK